MSAATTETTGNTKVRHIRIPDVIWTPAAEYAKEVGMNPSELVRDLLRDYIDKRERAAARAKTSA